MPHISMLRRSAANSRVAGVCGGVAEHWGVDPTLVRVGCVVLTLTSGIGLVAYVAAWLLIPRGDRQLSLIKEKWSWARRQSDTLLWIIAAVFGIACFFGSQSVFVFGIWPALLIGLMWYFGVHRQQKAQPTPPEQPRTPQAMAFEQAAEDWARRVTDHRSRAADGPHSAAISGSPKVWTQPDALSVPFTPVPDAEFLARSDTPFVPLADAEFIPPRDTESMPPSDAPFSSLRSSQYSSTGLRDDGFQPFSTPLPKADQSQTAVATRPRSPTRLWLIALSTAATSLATVVIVQAAGVSVPLAIYPTAVLLALGITLVIGAFLGRPRGLIVVAVIAAAVAIVAAMAPEVSGELAFGDLNYTYRSSSELPAELRAEVGDVTVDLSELTADKSANTDVHLGVGTVIVILPKSEPIDIDWRVGAGTTSTPDALTDGVNISGAYRHSPARPDLTNRPRVHLTVGVEVGDIRIES